MNSRFTPAMLAIFSSATFSLPGFAQTALQQPEAKNAKLEGGLKKSGPLMGGAEQAAPLQGGLNQAAPLQGGLQQQAAPLQGRLEQISLPGAELPVELTSKVSKDKPLADIKLLKMTPVLDLTETHKTLQGGLIALMGMTSFPDFIVGTWGGHLKVLTRQIIQSHISDVALVIGELGDVVVRFVKEQENVEALPATIFFQQRPVDREHHIMRREGDPDAKEDMQSQTFMDYGLIDLGSKHWHNAVGGQWQDQMLHNSLQRIGDNGAEQDIVFERSSDGKFYGYRETVVRYTWTSKTSIFMQAAVADFAPDRSLRKRTTLEGTITPDWHPVADEIGKITNHTWAQIDKIYDLKIDW